MSFLVLVFTRLALATSFILAPQSSQPQVPDTLYAAHYRPGLMEKVAQRRNLPLVDCMISSPWHKLNVWMRVTSQRNGETAICRTTDVSSPRHIVMHRRRQLIELDWNTAQRLCAITRVAQRPPRACPVKIEELSEEAALAALAPPAPPAPEQAAPQQPAPEQPTAPAEQPAPTLPTTATATLTDTIGLIPAPTMPTTDTAAVSNTVVVTP